MADAPFNTTFVNPVQLLGIDGAWPIGLTNPLPVELTSTSINVTAMITGTVILGNSTANIGSVNQSGTWTTIIGGSLPAGANPLGKINYNATTAQLTSGLINFSALGTSVVVTGSASTVITVYRMLLNNSTATGLTVQNGTNALTGVMNLSSNGGLVLDFDGEPWFVMSSAANFNIQINATSQISGRVYYLQA